MYFIAGVSFFVTPASSMARYMDPVFFVFFFSDLHRNLLHAKIMYFSKFGN